MERTAKHFRKRDAILSCLRQTTTHPSAEWIYNRLKEEYTDISLGTVYRNLALFKEQGQIISLGTVNGVENPPEALASPLEELPEEPSVATSATLGSTTTACWKAPPS